MGNGPGIAVARQIALTRLIGLHNLAIGQCHPHHRQFVVRESWLVQVQNFQIWHSGQMDQSCDGRIPVIDANGVNPPEKTVSQNYVLPVGSLGSADMNPPAEFINRLDCILPTAALLTFPGDVGERAAA